MVIDPSSLGIFFFKNLGSRFFESDIKSMDIDGCIYLKMHDSFLKRILLSMYLMAVSVLQLCPVQTCQTYS